MADDLAGRIDDLIYTLYGAVQRGIGYVAKYPGLGEVMDHIDEHVIDPSERRLMERFNSARVGMPEWRDVSPETNGHVRYFSLTPMSIERLDGQLDWSRDHYLDSCSGEIPWRALHHEPTWPCTECGHPQSSHHVDDEGWSSCTHGEYRNDDGWLCYPCNCGNNIGR